MAGPPRLYAIADAEILAPVELADAVETMVAAGVSWIQVRAKVMADDELFRGVGLDRSGGFLVKPGHCQRVSTAIP